MKYIAASDDITSTSCTELKVADVFLALPPVYLACGRCAPLEDEMIGIVYYGTGPEIATFS